MGFETEVLPLLLALLALLLPLAIAWWLVGREAPDQEPTRHRVR